MSHVDIDKLTIKNEKIHVTKDTKVAVGDEVEVSVKIEGSCSWESLELLMIVNRHMITEKTMN